MSMWGGGFDPDLGSKIDQILAGKPSAKQRVEEFLVDELHVDPSKIPLSLKDAKVLINQKMGERDSSSCRFQGNSMGLAYVDFFKSAQDEPSGCPNCPSGNGAYVYANGNGKWVCDDCEQEFTWTPPPASSERVTERSDKAFWSDLLRVYTALCKGVTEHKEDDAPPVTFTKFVLTHSWNEADATGVPDTKPRWKRADKYPTGAQLRVTNGTESVYVRIGGLFSDTDVVNLATMKPIEKVSAWTVVEVLDDATAG